MADKSYTAKETNKGDWLVSWLNVTDSDTFQIYDFKGVAQEISLHTTGAFGGATITYKGSNDGTEGVVLTRLDASDAIVTTETMFSILQRPKFITPTHTGGSSESVSVYMQVKM